MPRVDVDAKRRSQKEALDWLYPRMPVGEEKEMSYAEISLNTGVSASAISNLFQILQEVSSFRKRMSARPINGKMARVAYWTRLDEAETIKHKLSRLWAREDEKWEKAQHRPRHQIAGANPKLAVQPSPPTPQAEATVYVTGEEAPSVLTEVLAPMRKDDAYALVEAARGYASRDKEISRKLKELEMFGVVFDEKSIVLPTDEKLEHIKDVLPYIERLEATVTRQHEELARRRDYDIIKRDLGKLRERHNLEVAQRHQNTAATTAAEA